MTYLLRNVNFHRILSQENEDMVEWLLVQMTFVLVTIHSIYSTRPWVNLVLLLFKLELVRDADTSICSGPTVKIIPVFSQLGAIDLLA